MSSKEKNIQQEVDANRKKEHTSVLEKIRKRTGLLVGIVGLALVIFILESLLGSGASIFGSDEMSSAGHINGKKIDRNEFINRLEGQINNYRQRNQGKEVDDQNRSQMIETIWQQYVIDLVMKPQFNKIGISVGEDELYEAVVVNPVQTIIQNLSDPNTGKVNEQFSKPDGTLDPVKWRQAVQNVTGDNEMAVRQMEDQVKVTRYFEKFRALITKGLYITTAEAKDGIEQEFTKMTCEYVVKRYETVSDSAVKYTDDDLKNFYNGHTYQYKSLEISRSIEYVPFNVVPSAEDLALMEKDAQRVASEFKGRTLSEDSSFIAQESEEGVINIQNFSKKTMIIRDSSVYVAAPGTVFGPYNEGAYFKIYKLEGVSSVADSARVRHILIGINDAKTNQPKRSMVQAKREADSLLVLIKAKKVSFDTLVKTISDDLGSADKGGDYGWFDENKGFVDPFKNAGLMGTKGTISVVETQFGYHIIEVLEVSKARHNSYKVAQIFKLITPSDETNQKIFGQANQFAGENNTAELFDKAVEAQKLTKRVASNVKEGDYQLPGLTGVKDLVKWVYTANKGDISIFSFTDKHVVVKLAGIRNKGIIPFEDIKAEVIVAYIKAKKAETIIAEFNSKAANAKTIQEVASKMDLPVLKKDELTMLNPLTDALGHDVKFTGTVAGLKPGVVSKAIDSDQGVFVTTLVSKVTTPDPKSLKDQKTNMEHNLGSRTDSEVFNALKEMSEIDFHKSRVD